MVTFASRQSRDEEDIRQFSARLNELLDARGFTPKGKGRQVELGKKYDLTQKAVRKWVEGEGLPETVRLMQIARDFGCHFEWLATGRGPRDIGPSAGHAQAELLRRYEAAQDDTKKLIELALYLPFASAS